MFFLKRDKKGGVCGSGDEKELEKYIEYFFFFFMTECVFILTPCNIDAISALIAMNNIRKELVMIASRVVNLALSLWVSPGPLFIKPPFRGPPNEGAKKKPQPPKPPL